MVYKKKKNFHRVGVRKKECEYCGDAPASHFFSLSSSFLSSFIDSTFAKLSKLVPKFFIIQVESFLRFLPKILVNMKLVRLSSDIEKATTLRSRVVWEEAKRRGIPMHQLVLGRIFMDNYHARVNDTDIYFNSLPVPHWYPAPVDNWDDKYFLKTILKQHDIPVPDFALVPFSKKERKKVFDKLNKPLIVKPRVGSRGRHTSVGIHTFDEFEKAYKIARRISYQVVAEEYLEGDVCRATFVEGSLVGFYRASSAFVSGDGTNTLENLIKEKNKNKNEKIKEIKITNEMEEFLQRSGLALTDVPEKGRRVKLSYRTGRYFGGETKEMLDEIHPSFISVLEGAASLIPLPVIGLDVITPAPALDPSEVKWGIIECNTLPFIDLHYFALEGKPRNIAGRIWDLWYKK